MIEVLRLPRQYAHGFERIPNHAIDDTDLSIAALGLLARLLRGAERFSSIDEIADFYAAGNSKRRGRGRETYRNAAKELEAAGYLIRTEDKQAGKRMKLLVTAVPGNTQQLKPATSETPRPRPAELDEKAGRSRDVSGSPAATSANTAFSQVNTGTSEASWPPPGETTLSAGDPRDVSDVPAPICRPNPNPDLLLHASAAEEMEEEDADAFEPHPDALAVIAAVDLGGMALVGKVYDEVARILTRKLAEGWTPQTLAPRFTGCTVKATNPPGAFAARVRALGSPPTAAPALPRSAALPRWCGSCGGPEAALARSNPQFRTLDGEPDSQRCPDCHPLMIGATP
jgi:hypothetical protein